jgi:hypothetical protein
LLANGPIVIFSSLQYKARYNDTTEPGATGWKGDYHMGGAWNELSILWALIMGVPLVGLLAAVATYGSLWGLTAPIVL